MAHVQWRGAQPVAAGRFTEEQEADPRVLGMYPSRIIFFVIMQLLAKILLKLGKHPPPSELQYYYKTDQEFYFNKF